MRTIKTCNGIGDFIWILQKLINQPEKFDFIINSSTPQRAHQLAGLLPQLINSISFEDKLGYNTVKGRAYKGLWKNAPKQLYLEANSWLEEGKRIETFLPDLETSFILPYQTTEESKMIAYVLLGNSRPKYIGIYTSAYSNARQWNGWTAKEWLQLIRLIQDYNKEYKFVIIGATFDIGIPDDIMQCLSKDDYINTIGQPLPVVIEILKRLDLFCGFPSGLSIINETIGAKKTLMFYPSHLKKLIGAWPDPERIKNNKYKGCIFCPPEQIFEWMKHNWSDLF